MIEFVVKMLVMFVNGALLLISSYTYSGEGLPGNHDINLFFEKGINKELKDEAVRFREVFNPLYMAPDFKAEERVRKKEGITKLYFKEKLDITAFLQEKTWYCGPASTYCVLSYLNGPLDENQDKVAQYLETGSHGTSIHDIVKVLNEKNKKGMTFETANIGSIEEFAFYIKDSMEKGKPVIPEIATEGLNWPYFTDGHYVVIKEAEIYSEGTDSKGYPVNPRGRIVIADPLWKQEGKENEYSLQQLYDAVKNFWGSWIVK